MRVCGLTHLTKCPDAVIHFQMRRAFAFTFRCDVALPASLLEGLPYRCLIYADIGSDRVGYVYFLTKRALGGAKRLLNIEWAFAEGTPIDYRRALRCYDYKSFGEIPQFWDQYDYHIDLDSDHSWVRVRVIPPPEFPICPIISQFAGPRSRSIKPY